ncbi:hypothetical protein LSAT2_024812, partial [Lamellibrachia satsuma]
IMEQRFFIAALSGLLLTSIAAQDSCKLVRNDGNMLICEHPSNWELLLEELKTKTYDHQPRTVIIDCEHKISIDKFKCEGCDLGRMMNLTISRCNTRLVELKDAAPFLVNLDLSRNALNSLSCTTGLAELGMLDLQRNNIAHIGRTDFSQNTRLNTILLNSNRITDVESGTFDHIVELQEVDLSNNSLETIGGQLFRDLKYLTKVRLTANKIKHIDMNAFVNVHLHLLDLSHNDITTVLNSAFVTTSVISLNLSNCQIGNIPFGFLSSLKQQLITLDMSNNDIASLPSNAFVHLSHLQVIYLSGNRLTTTDNSMFPPSIVEVNFNSPTTTTTQITSTMLQTTTTA